MQYQKMVDKLEDVPDIARGMFKGDQTAFWEEMAEHLNALGPPIRTGATWKRVWFDYKCAVKKKLRVNKASLLATGGGPFHQRPLNDVEERVADLTNLKATIEGNSGRAFGDQLCTMDSNNNNNNNQLLANNNNEQNLEHEQPYSEMENNEQQNPVVAKARQKRSRKRRNTEAVLRLNEELLQLMKRNIEAQKESTAALTKVAGAIDNATAALKEAMERLTID
ncbi:TSET complex member tstA-like [Anopheles arabiensis]|uniref:TSET complex member tstA-like n=1 Tax=Anopheles arabiensis TaxID=7173 RepID=UPI001AACEF1E|nr:TSET complex member tstA-like [Anopheles arabiensis]